MLYTKMTPLEAKCILDAALDNDDNHVYIDGVGFVTHTKDGKVYLIKCLDNEVVDEEDLIERIEGTGK